jgi:hypothetical protein
MSERPTDGPIDAPADPDPDGADEGAAVPDAPAAPHGLTDGPAVPDGPYRLTDGPAVPDVPHGLTDGPVVPDAPAIPDGPLEPDRPADGPVEPAGPSRRTREMTRLAVLAVALAFIAAFGFLTFASVVEEGEFSLASLLSVFILVLFAVGIVGALRNPPR